MGQYKGVEIAIIGMSGRFPGADDVVAFWENLAQMKESITFFDREEALKAGEDEETLENPSYVKASAYLEGKEFFDSKFFEYRPDEARLMDPQMRIFHEQCWKAIEDAGYNVQTYDEKIGLFAGGTPNNNWENYSILSNLDNDVEGYAAAHLRNITNLCARVAYMMNLQGPAVFINTACSTSLVAIQRACMSLLLRECNMVLAGGVTITNDGLTGYVHEEGMILSKDGHCRAFDVEASGTVGGEGVGVVVLKRLTDAIKDGDNIHAVIRGGAINNDGHQKMAFSAPSVEGQSKAILKALNMAGIPPESISYVESHGTGTKLGDPIEIEALTRAFGRSENKYCAIGSVKSNIGHLDAAAGVAGLIKTVLSMKNKQLVPSLHFKKPNPEINFADSPFYVNTKLTNWENKTYPLRAGVSSFGIGGTNAHIILEEAPTREAGTDSRSTQLLTFSAKSTDALYRNIASLESYLQSSETTLADIAFTLQVGRVPFHNRHTIACNSKEEAIKKIRELKDRKKKKEKHATGTPKIVMMFPGQSAQYAQMARDLYEEESYFRQIIDECFQIAEKLSSRPFKAVLFAEEKDELNDTAFTQPLLFIVEYALARLLLHWGLKPHALIGHSLGEYTAACISEVFNLETALAVIIKRGELMQQVPGGAMLSIALSEDALSPVLNNYPGISVAAINSVSSCVVSGEKTQIQAVAVEMKKQGHTCKLLPTSHAFHSQMMDGILEEFEASVNEIVLSKIKYPFISNVTGEYITQDLLLSSAYWVNHLRKPVRFSKGLEELLKEPDVIFVEVGPGRTLSSLVQAHPDRQPAHRVVNMMRNKSEELSDLSYLIGRLGILWEHGVSISWDNFYAKETRRRLSLPTYSFDKTAYPVHVDAYKMITDMMSANPLVKKKKVSEWLYTPTWKILKRSLPVEGVEMMRTLLFCDEAGVGNLLLEKLHAEGEEVILVKAGLSYEEVEPNVYLINPDQKSHYDKLFKKLKETDFFPECIIHAWGISHRETSDWNPAYLGQYFYSLLDIIKACELHDTIAGKQVVLVTNGLHPVLASENAEDMKAMALALLKVVSQEYADTVTSHIDIDLGEKDREGFADLMYGEVKDRVGGKTVSLRNMLRWGLLYDQVVPDMKDGSTCFRNAGVYLITGGLGKLGITLAGYLKKEFGAKVALLGRTVLPPREQWNDTQEGEEKHIKEKVQQMHMLENQQGEVMYLSVDISDADELEKAVNEIEKKWGVIHGVIHAAGIVTGSSFSPIGKLRKENFNYQFGPKVHGLHALKRVFGSRVLDFCLLTSSLSTVLGGLQYGAYASANIYMDYFVRSHRSRGELQNWISVNFDGLDFEDDVTNIVNTKELCEVFEKALYLRYLPQVVVSTTDLDLKLAQWISANKTENIELAPKLEEETDISYESASEIEQHIAAIWQKFFGMQEIDVETDFFELGGDSLQALTIIKQINKAMRLTLSLTVFFAHASIQSLANYIQSLKAGDEKEEENYAGNFQAIPTAPLSEYYPLSSVQKRLYFIYEYDKNSVAYNMPQVVKLQGHLEQEKLTNAFNQLIARHSSLRTSFTMVEGEVVQHIHDHLNIEIETFSKDDNEIEAAFEEFVRPFDLGTAPLLRVGLISLHNDVYVLMVDMHHIISDGVSHDVLIKDFMIFYDNQELPPLSLDYKDYAVWQQSTFWQEKIKEQEAFWLNEFAEIPEALELPLDFERSSRKKHEGSTVDFELEPSHVAALRQLAKNEGTTLFMVFLAIYNILLSKLCRSEDIVIGTSTAGREHHDLSHIIGMFVNTLPLRNTPEGDLSFNDFLAMLKKRTIACFDNQSYPYESLIEALKVERNILRNPLFDVMFSYENYETSALEINGLEISAHDTTFSIAKFDLTLIAVESEDEVALRFEYSTSLFLASTIKKMAQYFKKITAAIISNSNLLIKDISILSDEENDVLTKKLNPPMAVEACPAFLNMFADQVATSPEAVAIDFYDKQVTYEELDKWSNQVAHQLREMHDIQPRDTVGLVLDRSDLLLVALLGILKSGATYVPIDPTYPSERKKYIANNAGIKLLISEMHYLLEIDYYEGGIFGIDIEFIPGQYSSEKPGIEISDSQCAYVVYTSGSTGQPKGVRISHGSLGNYLTNAVRHYVSAPSSSFALFTSISFDLTVTCIFTPLVSGNKVVIYKEIDNVLLIEKVLTEAKSNIIKLTPSHLQIVSEHLEDWGDTEFAVDTFIVGGEELESHLAAKIYQLFRGKVRICNEYGPTEATVGCMFYEYCSSDVTHAVPIGLPMSGMQVYLLDPHQNPVPAGVIGEMYISGRGLAMGYHDNLVLTSRSFIDNPFIPGQKMYRTGDLAVRQGDGNMIFKGRGDEQLKVRGYRIEPGEIERHLLAYDGVQEAVVIGKEWKGARQLIAYYVASQPYEDTALRGYLLKSLPEYMAPAYYVQLDTLPLTGNGKLDKKALPDPGLAKKREFVALQTQEENILGSVWAKVLGVDQLGALDNFFSYGGDSIKSIQISARLRSLGYDLPVKDILGNPILKAQAAQLRTLEVREADQSLIEGNSMLSPIQQWYFNLDFKHKAHFNQSVMLSFPEGISSAEVDQIFTKLQLHHDVLRSVFKEEGDKVNQYINGHGQPLLITEKDFRNRDENISDLSEACNTLQTEIDLATGPLMKLGLFHLKDGSRLLIVLHHLITDGVSWRILFDDIELLYRQLKENEILSLPPKTTSFPGWVSHLSDYITSTAFERSRQYWQALENQMTTGPIRDRPEGNNTISDVEITSIQMDKTDTRLLLTDMHRAYHTRINDALLAALAKSFSSCFGQSRIKVDMEGHGRQSFSDQVDVNRTVGWFTSIYPVIMDVPSAKWADILVGVKEHLRNIPQDGVDYLLYKYETNESAQPDSSAKVSFNYLGQFDTDTDDKLFQIASEPVGEEISQEEQRHYDWELVGMVVAGQLEVTLTYSAKQYDAKTVTEFMDTYKNQLKDLIHHAVNLEISRLTPADVTHRRLSVSMLNTLQERYPVEDIYPLSPMQEGLLFHALVDEKSDSYFEQITYQMTGKLDISSVKASLGALMARYSVLRTLFLHEGYDRPMQVVLKERPLDFTYHDIREACREERKEVVIEAWQQKDRSRKFDLSKDLLIRVLILQVGDEEYAFIWSHHHIIMDGWCMSIIINDFDEFYNHFSKDGKLSLPEPVPYVNYISWLSQRDSGDTAAYWNRYLEGYENKATLPQLKDMGAPYQQHIHKMELSKVDTQGLQLLGAEHSVTLNTIIQTAWAIVLARYNFIEDVVFGSVVSGRPAEIEGVENMVGLFINTLPVRISFEKEDTIDAALKKVQKQAIEAEQHHYSPLSEIQSRVPLGKELLDHIIVFENYPIADQIEQSGAEIKDDEPVVTDVEVFEQTNYNLSLMVIPGESLTIKFYYNLHVFESVVIEQVSRQLQHIIWQLVKRDIENVYEFQLATNEEKNQLLDVFNQTQRSYPKYETIVTWFEKQVNDTPDTIALVFGQEKITYRVLNERANRLAYKIAEHSPEGGQNIAIYCQPAIEMIAGILAIVKSGNAYVPLSTESPFSRNEFIYRDSKVVLLLVQKHLWEHQRDEINFVGEDNILGLEQLQDESVPSTNLSISSSPEDLLYIIYTSGTTSRPKGVEVKHSGIVNMVHFFKEVFNMQPGTNLSQVANISFDASAFEIWPCLLGGGCLHIAPAEKRFDPGLMKAWLHENEIAITFQPTAIAEHLLKATWETSHSTLKIMNVAGDRLNFQPEEELPFRVYNLYGPTEDSVWTTWSEVSPQAAGKPYTIGKPIANKQVFILDQHRQVLPVGAIGEIGISGAGLAHGYVGDTSFTDRKFIEHPVMSGQKLYLSGDIGRWLPDGTVEFLGRIDNQLKIRGFRVESGEVEACLSTCPGIKEAAVVARGKEGNKFLVAYYVTDDEQEVENLKEHLLQQLPSYMVPAYFVRLDKMPLTTNGKIERKALPEPVLNKIEEKDLPVNDTQGKLVEIWAEVLSLSENQIGISKNFFDIGGNSIHLVTLTTKINQSFKSNLSVADMFRLPTITAIEHFLEKGDQEVEKVSENIEEAISEADENINLLNDLIK